MTRALGIAVVATLVLPVLALAALVGQQEVRFAEAQTVSVPVRGVDPRDLLRGHYLVGQFDWNWDVQPAKAGTGGLCVLPGDAARPSVRFLDGWQAGDRSDGCRLVISGRVHRNVAANPTFVPTTLDSGSASVRLFVSETRAPELERLIRERPGAFTVDLAVRRDGSAAVRALRLDGQILGR